MDYEKNYYDYISYVRSLNRKYEDDVYEIHHIIPRSFGGTDEPDNLVLLTLREHYLAHYLLYKFNVEGKKTKMLYAFTLMSNINKNMIFSSRLYERLKRETTEKRSIKVICLETKKIYSSINEAAYDVDLKYGWSLSISLRNKKRTSAGYHWAYFYENIDYTKNPYYGREKELKYVLVRLEDAKMYSSYKEASIENNCAIGTIGNCVKPTASGNSTAAGFHWRKFEEGVDYTKNPYYGCKKTLNQSFRRVVCLETGEIFSSQSEAAREKSIVISGDIKRSCENKNFTSAGYHWSYFDENIDYTKTEYYGRERKKGRQVLCIETGKKFSSLKEAANEFGLYSSSLVSCLNGRQKTFAGYHWKELYE